MWTSIHTAMTTPHIYVELRVCKSFALPYVIVNAHSNLWGMPCSCLSLYKESKRSTVVCVTKDSR